MCFDICTINIRVSIRVRGLHLVKIIFFINLLLLNYYIIIIIIILKYLDYPSFKHVINIPIVAKTFWQSPCSIYSKMIRWLYVRIQKHVALLHKLWKKSGSTQWSRGHGFPAVTIPMFAPIKSLEPCGSSCTYSCIVTNIHSPAKVFGDGDSSAMASSHWFLGNEIHCTLW